MPWKRFGKCVFKTTKTGKKKEKQGCSDSVPMAKKYLKALYANASDVSEQVDEYINEIILSEARYKDIKEKYPEWHRSGMLDDYRNNLIERLGQKGASKYLLYWVRSMDQMEGGPTAEDIKAEEQYLIPTADNVVDLIAKFNKNLPRLIEKDIYKYTITELEQTLDNLGDANSEERRKRKLKAEKESELVYDDNDIYARRPLTEFASIYYGMATRWCISATECRNYFDEYTRDGKAFSMVNLKNLRKEDTPFYKTALVYDQDAQFESLFDSEDSEFEGIRQFREAVALNHKRTGQNYFDDLDTEEQDEITEIVNDIVANGTAVIENNPVDVAAQLEEEAKQLEAEYQKDIKHGYFKSTAVPDGGYLFFKGGFEVAISKSKFTKQIPQMKNSDVITLKAEREIFPDIEQMLDTELRVYIDLDGEDRQIYQTEEDYVFVLPVGTQMHNFDPSGYEGFLAVIAEYDDKYAQIVRMVELVLSNMGFIDRSNFDSFNDEELDDQLENFSVIRRDAGEPDADIVIMSPLIPLDIDADTYGWKNKLGLQRPYNRRGFSNEQINNAILSKLRTFTEKVNKYLKRQLSIPGIGREINQLQIPEMLEVRFENNANNDGVRAFMFINIEDFSITKETLDSITSVLKYMDENYEQIENIVKEESEMIFSNLLNQRDAEIEAGEQLATADAQDGTEPVNEVKEYFKELLKTELDRRIENMTIKEWLDPYVPAPWDNDYEDKK